MWNQFNWFMTTLAVCPHFFIYYIVCAYFLLVKRCGPRLARWKWQPRNAAVMVDNGKILTLQQDNKNINLCRVPVKLGYGNTYANYYNHNHLFLDCRSIIPRILCEATSFVDYSLAVWSRFTQLIWKELHMHRHRHTVQSVWHSINVFKCPFFLQNPNENNLATINNFEHAEFHAVCTL